MQNNHIASNIKLICKQKGFTIASMLSECKIGKSFMYDLEKRAASPSCDKVSRIADFLDCSVDYLLGRSDTTQLTVSDDAHFVALIKYYETLNETGRSEAEKRIEELTQIPKYIEPERKEEFNIG